jgi:SOS-response transcriptional repressor LexA
MAWTFSAPLWRWKGDSPWHFITLPFDVADDLDEVSPIKAGFGSVPVTATIGQTTWTTSVFPSKEAKSFMLPVKKDVRSREGLNDGDVVSVRLSVNSADQAGRGRP